jgi:hypothetical protein
MKQGSVVSGQFSAFSSQHQYDGTHFSELNNVRVEAYGRGVRHLLVGGRLGALMVRAG